MKRFLIIDGSSLLYRAFFAMPPLSSATGIPTNAVYGFLNMYAKLYEEIRPDMVAVTFDRSRNTFRRELYPDYKAQRKPTPDELRQQFALIQEVLTTMGVRSLDDDRYEGDDIIGSLTKQWASDAVRVTVVSGDKDILQLVGPYTTVYITKKGITDMERVTPDTIEELYGYSASMVPELKGLMGDTSDNIPGVKGIGEKTALKLLQAYQSIDGIYEHVEDLKGKMKERLVENREMAFLSRQLATISQDMVLSYDDTYFIPEIQPEALRELFGRLGFHRLVDKFLGLNGDDVATVVNPYEREACLEMPAVTFSRGTTMSIAFSTVSEVPHLEMNSLAIYDGDTLHVVPQEMINLEILAAICEGAKQIVTTDSKALYHILYQAGHSLDMEKVLDITLLSYLLDPTRNKYEVAYFCERFGLPVIHETDSETILQQTAVALPDIANLAVEEIKNRHLYKLYVDMERPLVATLAHMETRGIYTDRNLLEELRSRYKEQLETLEKQIYELAGETFKINSPKQLSVILFEKLALPVIRKTKTGYSTDAEVLEILRTYHPIVDCILEYRAISKLLSTYVEGLFPLIEAETSRIHTQFNQMVTATGRLSSSNPNLQNIPVRTERGREIRSIFLPGPGYDAFVSADYSQIELRILAHLSQDPGLMRAFAEGLDIHRYTAGEVLGKDPSEVTSEERSHAKAVNFGLIYGLSDFGLARDLGITREAAKSYIDTYFARYPSVKGYMETVIAKGREDGFVTTMCGRVRELPDLNSKNFNVRNGAERAAMNTPIQGSAADIIKLAMNEVEKRLLAGGYRSRLLLQVHDELLLEVVESEREEMEQLLRDTMEKIVSLRVPLVVDVHSAANWALVK